MSLLSILVGRGNDDDRIKRLEKRVEDLETVLLELSANLMKLSALSLRTGEELDNVVRYIKSKEGEGIVAVNSVKKTDDFYN